MKRVAPEWLAAGCGRNARLRAISRWARDERLVDVADRAADVDVGARVGGDQAGETAEVEVRALEQTAEADVEVDARTEADVSAAA